MTKEFRQLLIFYTISAILFFTGFYFVNIPAILQVALLLLAIVMTIFTFIKSMKLLIRQFNDTRN